MLQVQRYLDKETIRKTSESEILFNLKFLNNTLFKEEGYKLLDDKDVTDKIIEKVLGYKKTENLVNDLSFCMESQNFKNLTPLKAYLFFESAMKCIQKRGQTDGRNIFFLLYFLDVANFYYGEERDDIRFEIIKYYNKIFKFANEYHEKKVEKNIFDWLDEQGVERSLKLNLPVLYRDEEKNEKIVCFVNIKLDFRTCFDFVNVNGKAFPFFDFEYKLTTGKKLVKNSGFAPAFDEIYVDGFIKDEKHLEPEDTKDYYTWMLENSGVAVDDRGFLPYPFSSNYEKFVSEIYEKNKDEYDVINLSFISGENKIRVYFIEKRDEAYCFFKKKDEVNKMEELKEFERTMVSDDEGWYENFKDEDLI